METPPFFYHYIPLCVVMSIKQEKATNWYEINQGRLFACEYQDDKITLSDI